MQEPVNYYNTKQSNLGETFYNRFEESVDAIKQNPFRQIRYKNVRLCTLTQFPYVIHYEVYEDEKLIVILGVRNTAQNPDTSYF